MVRRTTWTAVLLLLVVGCGRKGHSAQGDGQAKAAKPRYSAAFKAPSLRPGQQGDLVLTLRPAAGLKWNVEYPTVVKIPKSDAGPVQVLTQRIKKRDPRLKETKEQAVVQIPLKATTRGSASLEVVASFSVCTDKVCHILRNRSLEADVAVQ